MPAQTVLLVDHDEDSRIMYSAMLQHHGFVVVEARDGEEGLRLARRMVPDVVIVDLHARALDGCTLVRMLKARKATARVQAIVLTTDVSPSSHERAREAGCALVVMKPVRPTELIALVRFVMGPLLSIVA